MSMISWARKTSPLPSAVLNPRTSPCSPQYWDDDALMSKISAKMHRAQKEKEAQMEKDGTAPPPKPPAPIVNLFDAAKAGDVEAARRMIDEGADVNAKVHRVLGVHML